MKLPLIADEKHQPLIFAASPLSVSKATLFACLVALGATTALPGCGGGTTDDDPVTDAEDQQEDQQQDEGDDSNDDDSGNDDENQVVDITNAKFTNRSGRCESYVGEYEADVVDVNRGSVAFEGEVTITSNGSKCTFSSNEIPNHNFNDGNANFATNVSEQTGSYQVAVSPQMATQVTDLNLSTTNAIFLNGATVDLLPAACYDVGNEPLGREKIGCGQDQIDNPWRYDPMSTLNNFGTDTHNAHTQPDGTYHYHGNPLAMFETECESSGDASPVIGFAADGFPIYGTCFDDNGTVRLATSSYKLKTGARQTVSGYTTPVGGQGDVDSNNYDGQFRGDYEYQQGQGDLDECNGMTVNGQYGYYVTNAFPWVLNCYKGSVDSSFSKVGASSVQYGDVSALKGVYHSHH